MKKEERLFTGSIDAIPENQIYLNINHLNDGRYVLKIIHKNKVIVETTFNKTN